MSNLRAWLTEKSSEQTEHFLGEIPRLWLVSGQINKLYSLLSNYDFIEAKINHRSFGVQALIEDYNLIDVTDLSTYLEHNDESIKCLKLIQGTLQLSAHILAEDTTQLASQLWGRLQHSQIPPIQQLLQTTKLSSNIWLRPLSSSLIPAGGRLQRILTGHTSAVNVVTITSDAKRAISGSKDGVLKVWDLQTGKELFSLKGHKSSVTSVVSTPDNKYIISSSEDKTLRVWSFSNGQELFKLAQGVFPVRTLVVTSDGKQVISLRWDKSVNRLQNKTHNASSISIKVTSWNLTTRKDKTLFKSAKDFDNVILTNDGKYLVLSEEENRKTKIMIVNLEANEEDFCFKLHITGITIFDITSDKKYMIYGCSENEILHMCTCNLKTGKVMFVLEGYSDTITSVTITPDGRQAISTSKDKTIKIWSLETGEEINSIAAHSDVVNSIAISSDCKQAISASDDKTLNIFSLNNIDDNITTITNDNNEDYDNDKKECLNFINVILFIAKLPLVILSRIATIFIQIFGNFIHFINNFSLAFFVIDIIFYKQIIAFLKLPFVLPFSIIFAICLSFIYLFIIINPVIDAIRRLIIKESVVATHTYHQMNPSLDNQFPRENDCNDSTNIDNKLIGTENLKHFTQRIYGSNHSESVTALTVNRSDHIIVSGSDDKTIRLWNLRNGEQNFIVNAHRDKITSICSIPNSKKIISISLDKTFVIWNLETLKKESYFKSLSIFRYEMIYLFVSIILMIFNLIFLARVKNLLLAGIIGYFTEWMPCKFISNMINESDCDKYSKIVVTSDSKRLLSGSRDKTIKVWSLKSRRHILTLLGHTDWITSIAVTPDSKRVISGSKDTTLKVWYLNTRKTRKLIHTFHGHSSSVNAVAITPDGLQVISGDSNGCLIIWDLLTRDKISTISAHNNSIEAIAVTSDGRYFISVASDHTLKLWDLSSGEKIACFTADSPLTSCIIAPDDLMIIAGDKAGQIHRLSLEGIMA